MQAINVEEIEGLDEGIRPAVEILSKHGFITYESCQGGKGHTYPEATVRFYGGEYDLLRAYDICEIYKLNLIEGKRIFRKEPVYDENKNWLELGPAWTIPTNELTFAISSKTGTIFREH